MKKEILVHRSSSAIYAQLRDSSRVLFSKRYLYKTGKKPVEQSFEFGKDFAGLVMKLKAKTVLYNRGKRKYHGNIKAFAEGLRESGLEF
ncbi:MAG: 50S ribosomal protein L18 [Candidatus Berkelbacteria bacterium]|nr:50S ribosomal protein L18 [Candidatus Berkelbacteria bacterium]